MITPNILRKELKVMVSESKTGARVSTKRLTLPFKFLEVSKALNSAKKLQAFYLEDAILLVPAGDKFIKKNPAAQEMALTVAEAGLLHGRKLSDKTIQEIMRSPEEYAAITGFIPESKKKGKYQVE